MFRVTFLANDLQLANALDALTQAGVVQAQTERLIGAVAIEESAGGAVQTTGANLSDVAVARAAYSALEQMPAGAFRTGTFRRAFAGIVGPVAAVRMQDGLNALTNAKVIQQRGKGIWRRTRQEPAHAQR